MHMYNGKRIALVLTLNGLTRVASGLSVCDDDRDLGPVLRIDLDHDGRSQAAPTTLILQEKVLRNRLLPDGRYGCDFQVSLMD